MTWASPKANSFPPRIGESDSRGMFKSLFSVLETTQVPHFSAKWFSAPSNNRDSLQSLQQQFWSLSPLVS